MDAAPRLGLASVLDRVRHHAASQPDRTSLVFLPDGETEAARLSYAELDRRARALAWQWQAEGLAGQRVLLLLPTGPAYVVALLACLYAGIVAVPAYPPTNSAHAERVVHIALDCAACAAIVSGPMQETIAARMQPFLPADAPLRLIAIGGMGGEHGDGTQPAPGASTAGDALAYLQYTSGSTSHPRGVAMTHANVLAFCDSMQPHLPNRQGEVFVTWLPLFHDLGLIFGVLQPLCTGATAVLIPPLSFLQKPLRWLTAIHRYRGTVTCAPNFAYELCAASLDQPAIDGLDLSSLHFVVNAAEPVRADTLDRFQARFARRGFRPAAMNPAYGLAEATLGVTFHASLEAPRTLHADATALARGRLLPADGGGAGSRRLVSCGRAWGDTRVVIADPEHLTPKDDGQVGEILVSGSQVSRGYWNRPALNQDVFQARLATGEGPFLRTGDLGVMHEAVLYVTGRLKDLIIIRGLNHYPQDIEQTVFRASPALEVGHGAAFAIEHNGQERLVVVQEIRRSRRKHVDAAQVVTAIRQAIAAEHGIDVHAVLLLKPASVHLTSSGKIQRQACRQDYLQGRFEPLHAWSQDDAPARDLGNPAAGPASPATDERAISQWLTRAIAAKAGMPTERVSPDQPFTGFGLGSLDIVALADGLSAWLARPVMATWLYDHPNIGLLAGFLARQPGAAAPTAPPISAAAEPMAIVGMACRFPQADSIDAYWQLLASGTDAVTEIPADRWCADDFYDPATPPPPGRMNTRWGGFIAGVDQFDAAFFGISPREAQGMDPQQRLLLQTAWHALEDAGIAPDSLAGSNTGVFIGISIGDYKELQMSAGVGTDAHAGTGHTFAIAANRISYLLDLRGPSVAVDTACSSAAVAVHQARQSLLAGECDLAIVGGVNLLLSPKTFVALSQAGMMSPDGRCRTFDAGANGYVRGEGCGVVILKRHAKALQDRDRIAALIRGSAVNQDGRSNGLTAPNGVAQAAVIRQALASAGVAAADVSYVEAHGTGTSLGDPIEVDALKQAYGASPVVAPPLWIGSVKTNIGHLEAGAGIAGLIKTALALKHRQIPPHLHLRQLNPLMSLAGSRLAIPATLQPWVPSDDRPRLAGISSFGFGGTNAHLILQEAPDDEAPVRSAPQSGWQMFPLSAAHPAALRALAAGQAEALKRAPQAATLAALCHTAHVRRAHLSHRLAMLVESTADLHQAAEAFARGEPTDTTFTAIASQAPEGKAAFLFTGQGSPYAGMARQLYRRHAGFRATIDRCDAILRKLRMADPAAWAADGVPMPALAELIGGGAGSAAALDQTLHAQPALFAIGCALAALWQDAGLRPDCLLGHSVGEYAAACIAGVFSLEDGMKLVAHRGRLMQQRTPPGAMVAVQGPEALVSRLLSHFRSEPPADCAVAAHNSPEDAVLSGDADALRRWLSTWTGQDRNAALSITALPVLRAFHSPLMQAMAGEFAGIAREVTYTAPKIPLISNVSGQLSGAEIAGADYWIRHALAPVQFDAGLQSLAAAGCRLFVEMGPHPVLSAIGRRRLPEALWLHSLRRDQDDERELLGNLARWHVHGGRLDWARWTAARTGTAHVPPPPLPLPLPLPPYPFQADRHWYEPAEQHRVAAISPSKDDHPLLGHRLDLADHHHFSGVLSDRHPAFASQHRVFGTPVLPGAAMVEWARAAAIATAGTAPAAWLLEDVRFDQPLPLQAGARLDTQTIVDRRAEGQFAVRGFGRPQGEAQAGWTRHFSATALFLRPDEARERFDEYLAPAALTQHWPEMPVKAHYDRLSAAGFDHGPALRGIRRLWRQGPEALAWIECESPRDDPTPDSAYGLHPVMLDACSHLLAAFDVELAPGQALGLSGVRRLAARAPLPRRLWCRATWRGRVSSGASPCHEADFRVFDEHGHPVAIVEGWQLSDVARPADAIATEPSYCELAWVPLDRTPHATARTARNESGRLLLDVRGLVASGSVDAGDAGDAGDAACRLAEALLPRVQQFLEGTPTVPREIIVCTSGAHAVESGDAPDAQGLAQSAASGLVKAVIAEYRGLRCIQVDLPPGTVDMNLGALLPAIDQIDGAGPFAYRQGRWFMAQLQSRARWPRQPGTFEVHAEATYLVTGGMRGIGLAMADWLVRRGARSLLLCGRRIPGDFAATAQRWRAAGVRVEAMEADVADGQGVARAIGHVARHMPPLRGVIHAAGVIDDMALHRLDAPRLHVVMDGKVRGAWNLHTATRGCTLDFFVLCSSMASLAGSPGQANYVIANTFLDTLAHHRRGQGLAALSINWGVWGETGMAVRHGLVDRLASQGLRPMPTEAALRALQALLSSDATQAGACCIDWKQVEGLNLRADARTFLAAVLPAPAAAAQPQPDAEPQGMAWRERIGAMDMDEARAQIVEHLFQLLAQTLKWSEARRRDLRPGLEHLRMSALGVDSLMAAELRNRLLAGLAIDVPMPMFIGASKVGDVAGFISEECALDRVRNHAGTAGEADLEEFVL